jgi:glycosyltransferase involved in cell wall biosynthesis
MPEFPSGVAGRVIGLPHHSKSLTARVARNLSRAVRGVPPLVDRFSGFELRLEEALGSARFDVGVVEHFWCAPYADLLRRFCGRLILDLHNIESVLLRRQAGLLPFPARTVFQRFASSCAALERDLLPRFDTILVTSDQDRKFIGGGVVYPNAVPLVAVPVVRKREEIAFSGNLEYEPNYTAVQWFLRGVWPQLRDRHPELRLRLIGRGEAAVRRLVAEDERILLSGPVDDAIAELARARLAVAPLLAGSGTRIKIIEAWAAGLPVVSTTIGAEGLPGANGEHFLIADTAGDFVAAVEQVLSRSDLRQRLATNGRLLYEQRLAWSAAWKALESAGL